MEPFSLKEISATACIPLECGQALLEQLRKPTTVYVPYMFTLTSNGYNDLVNGRYCLDGVFSSKEKACEFCKKHKTVEESLRFHQKFNTLTIECMLVGFDPQLPIFLVYHASYPPFITQDEYDLKSHIKNQEIWQKFHGPFDIMKGFIDGEFSTYTL
jgi:hypothetical protein